MRNKTKIIQNMLIFLSGVTLYGLTLKLFKAMVLEAEKHADRSQSYANVETEWLLNKMNGRELSEILKDKKYNKIAIYGIGTLGELLYEDLKNSEIQICYFIDRTAEVQEMEFEGIPVVSVEKINSMPEVDCMILTPLADLRPIQKTLSDNGFRNDAISLKKLVSD